MLELALFAGLCAYEVVRALASFTQEKGGC